MTKILRKILPCLAMPLLAFSCCILSAQQPITVSVSVPASPFPKGEDVQVNVAVNCAPSCGIVFIFVDGAYTLGSGLNPDGTITTYGLSGIDIGQHTIQASYIDATNTVVATSPLTSFIVNPNNLPTPTGTIAFTQGFPVAGSDTFIQVALSCGSSCGAGEGFLMIDGTHAVGFNYLDANGKTSFLLHADGPQFTVGQHSATFRFFGNANYRQTTLPTISFAVLPAYGQQAVHMSVAVPASPFPQGETVQVKLTSTCAPSCGISFVFVDGQYVLGTGLEADGSITTYGLSNIGVGDHVIQALYQDPSGAGTGGSPPVKFTVIQNTLAPPTGAVTFNPSSPVSGSTAIMKIALTCGTACGPSVGYVVMDDVYLVGFIGLDADGTSTFQVNIDNNKPWWTTGPHTASFRFFGNANYRQTQLAPSNYIISSTVGKLYDAGQVTLTVNGVPKSVPYGQFQNTTSSAVASALASAINADANADVSATTNGSALNLAAKATGAASNYAFNVSQVYDTQDFTQPSFAATPASGTLAGGADGGTSMPSTIYSFSVTDSSNNSGYAANGNVVAYKDSVNGTWSDLGYDSLNRLTGGTQAPVGRTAQYFCWTYDSFGNRTLQSSSSAAYTTGSATCQTSGVPTTYAVSYNSNNRIVQTPSSTPSYDAAGNITSDDRNQYLYDDEGRVCAVYAPPPMAGMLSMTQYVYDAEGRRVAKGTITSFSCDMATNGFSLSASYVLGQGGEQVTEMNGNGQWVHTNVFAGGQLMATYDPDGTHFQITDWLGSRRVQADYQGRVESTYQNLPFGEFVPTNTNPPLGATEHHFTGKERDTESGLDYFGARYYASSMGRFSSPDPSGLAFADLSNPQSLNLYAYGQNNPLTNIDPTGLDCVHINNDTGNYEGFESGDCNNSTEALANSGHYVDGTVNQISFNGQNQVSGYSASSGDGFFDTPGSNSGSLAANLNPYTGALSGPGQSASVTANQSQGLSTIGSTLTTLIPNGPLQVPNLNISHYVSAAPPRQKLTQGQIYNLCLIAAQLQGGGTVPGGSNYGTASTSPSEDTPAQHLPVPDRRGPGLSSVQIDSASARVSNYAALASVGGTFAACVGSVGAVNY